MTNELTEKEAEQIVRDLVDKKQNVYTFFRDVVQSEDTTKTANLGEEELGQPKLPLRSVKELELFARDVYKKEALADYFKKLGEILTSTSLSKEGILLKLSVTNKQELADVTPKKKKENKGWFKKKE